MQDREDGEEKISVERAETKGNQQESAGNSDISTEPWPPCICHYWGFMQQRELTLGADSRRSLTPSRTFSSSRYVHTTHTHRMISDHLSSHLPSATSTTPSPTISSPRPPSSPPPSRPPGESTTLLLLSAFSKVRPEIESLARLHLDDDAPCHIKHYPVRS